MLESDNAHNRTICHLHQELESTVELEQTLEVRDRLLDRYRELYGS